MAVANDRFKMMEYLVRQGANVNITNKWGKTALMSAAKIGNLAMVQYLVDQGADISIQNERLEQP